MTQTALPRAALSVLSACYFALAIASLSVIGLLIPMRDGLGVGDAEIAYLVSAFSITYAISAPLAQVIAGDWDRRRLIILALLAVALGTALTGITSSYGVAVTGRMIMAVGAGVLGPMASAAGAALVSPERRGAALGHVFSGMTIATVLGVPMVTWLGAAIGWRAALLVVAGFSLCTALLVWAIVPDHPRGQRASLGAIRAILTDRVLGPAISITGWQMAAQFATYSVIAVYTTARFGLPEAWLPIALAGYGTGGILGNWLATRTIDRVGPNRLILLSLLVTFGAFALLQVFGTSIYLGMTFLFVWSVAGLALFAPQQARLIALRPDAANLLLALNGSAIYVGMGVGSAISGFVSERTGTDWLALVSAMLMAAALLAYWISRRAEDAVNS